MINFLVLVLGLVTQDNTFVIDLKSIDVGSTFWYWVEVQCHKITL
jgi:hypothetical protein